MAECPSSSPPLNSPAKKKKKPLEEVYVLHLSLSILSFWAWFTKLRSYKRERGTSHQSEWPSSKNLQTINAGENMEKREPSCTVGGNVNWYSHYGEQCVCVCVLVAQLCLTLCNPMDYSPPGCSVYGIFQARILECVAISFSKSSMEIL